MLLNTELGLNRTLEPNAVGAAVAQVAAGPHRKETVLGAWHVQSFDPKKPEQAYLSIFNNATATSHSYPLNRTKKTRNKHAKHMEGMRARNYEPLKQKGMVGRIGYKLRSSAALKHNPTLPWGTMNTREILNTKGT